jgi:GR25 family glycosyltransferase involved in LPS biosynthesis
MKIDKIYIIHYYKEKERREYIENYLTNRATPFEFRSLYNRDSVEVYNEEYFDQSEENKERRNRVIAVHGKVMETGMPLEWGERSRAYRACTLEHFKTYEHILLNTNYNNILILEDDAMFKDDFDDGIQKILEALTDTYDVCYIGSGCDMHLPYATDKVVDLHYQYYSRCSDSYIISRKALQKIVDTALPFFSAIDWELNYLQALNELNVYWATSPITYQGSQHGKYNSTFNII